MVIWLEMKENLPEFDDLPSSVKRAWSKAVETVLSSAPAVGKKKAKPEVKKEQLQLTFSE